MMFRMNVLLKLYYLFCGNDCSFLHSIRVFSQLCLDTIAMPDCDIIEGTSSDVVVSYAGCAGQRCMAASVLFIVGDKDGTQQKALLQKVTHRQRIFNLEQRQAKWVPSLMRNR